jgi:hypothetical protein
MSWGVLDLPMSFLARMSVDGRIVIPQLILGLFKHGKSTLAEYVFDVTLEPS